MINPSHILFSQRYNQIITQYKYPPLPVNIKALNLEKHWKPIVQSESD